MLTVRTFENENTTQAVLDTITDWYSLGAAIGVKTGTMAWVLKSRDSMQSKIRLGERIVFKSAPALRFVQSRLCSLFDTLFDKLPDNSAAIAYRKGITATEIVKNTKHAKALVSFDIRHYYDNITLKILRECLVDAGMDKSGAMLAARYCVVRKGTRRDGAPGRLTLQQGSPASPVLSNIVGYFLMDMPIQNWIKTEFPDVQATFLRYCDNIALFVHNDAPEGFFAAYKEWVKKHMASKGFKTHKWATVSDSHPVLHQKFLGMVLNSEARAELDLVDRLRATLFNWCRNGLESAAKEFFNLRGIEPQYASTRLLNDKFVQHMRGHVQYVKRLNAKQGLVLEKLYKAAQILNAETAGLPYILGQQMFAAVKRYRDNSESVEDYLARLAAGATNNGLKVPA